MQYYAHGYDLVLEIDADTVNLFASAAFHSSFFTSFKGNAVIRGVDFPYEILISEPPYFIMKAGETRVRLPLHIISGSFKIDAVAYVTLSLGPGIRIQNIYLEEVKFWGKAAGFLGRLLINVILNTLPVEKLLRIEDLTTDVPLSAVIPSSMLYGSPTFNVSAASLASFPGSLAVAVCLNGCSMKKKTPLTTFVDGSNAAITVSELAAKDLLKDIWPKLSGPIVEKGVIDSVPVEFVSWLKNVSHIKRPFWGGSRAEINYEAEILSEMPNIRITDGLEMYDTNMTMHIRAEASIPKPFSSKRISIYTLETDATAFVERAKVNVYAENGRLLAKITDIEFHIDSPKSIPNLILQIARNRLESKFLSLSPIDLTEIMEEKIDHNFPFQPCVDIKSVLISGGIMAVHADLQLEHKASSYPFVADLSSNLVHDASCPGVNEIKGADRRGYASLHDAFRDGFKCAPDCLSHCRG